MELNETEKSLIADEKLIQAIKSLRVRAGYTTMTNPDGSHYDACNLGLKEAKDICVAYRDSLPGFSRVKALDDVIAEQRAEINRLRAVANETHDLIDEKVRKIQDLEVVNFEQDRWIQTLKNEKNDLQTEVRVLREIVKEALNR